VSIDTSAAKADRTESGQSLSALLRQSCNADAVAWNELVRRFGRLLLHTARGVGLSESDAADVAQLTWIRLWEHGHQIRDPECLPAWLVATARREALRVALSGKRYVLCADPATEHAERAWPAVTDVYPIDGEYEPFLEEAVARLPAGYQRLIRLLMSDNCPSYSEVARQLDLPIGSIGPMRMRALQMLRGTGLPRTGSFGRYATAQPAGAARVSPAVSPAPPRPL
jgi:RNA polymerase sigma factor (sigma-70 family)